MEIFIILIVCAAVWCGIGALGKRSDANRQAKATAREMKKAFTPSSGTQSSPYKPTESTWRCTSCGHENSEKLNYCLHCRTDRYAVSSKITEITDSEKHLHGQMKTPSRRYENGVTAKKQQYHGPGNS